MRGCSQNATTPAVPGRVALARLQNTKGAMRNGTIATNRDLFAAAESDSELQEK